MNFWKDNGTKVLGYGLTTAGTAAAAITMVDPALVAAVAGPKYGAYFALVAALVGGFVAKRGHTNTANSQPEQAPQQPQ
jgi:hypothetical protein